ncbi:hypothetical protein INT45_004226, partial [Circinella minor]
RHIYKNLTLLPLTDDVELWPPVHIFKALLTHPSRSSSGFLFVNTRQPTQPLAVTTFFHKNGLRTQFAADINDIILFVSKSEFCADSSDGSMFLNMKLYNKMNQNDTLAVDGGYTLFIRQFTELASEKGYEFNNDNLVYPIRKNINENLTITEEHFNNTFGSFRTKIENQFSEIGNKFYRFNNNKSIVKIDIVNYYNLQFRVAVY